MKHPVRRRLMFLGFQGLQALVRFLPLPVGRACGRALPWGFFFLPSVERMPETMKMMMTRSPKSTRYFFSSVGSPSPDRLRRIAVSLSMFR